MPHKKRGHAHRKNSKDDKEHGKGSATPPPEARKSRFSAFLYTPRSFYGQSQPKEATPKPAAQAPTGRPAQFEKASSPSAMASKSVLSTTATGGVAGGGITAGGSASTGTAGKVSTKTKTETNTTASAATVIDMSSAEDAVVDMTSAGVRGGPAEMSQTAPVSQVKTTLPCEPCGPRAPGAKLPSEPCGPPGPTTRPPWEPCGPRAPGGTLPSEPCGPPGPISRPPCEPCGPRAPGATLPPEPCGPPGPASRPPCEPCGPRAPGATLPPEPCGPPGPTSTLFPQPREPLAPTRFGAHTESKPEESPKGPAKSPTAITTLKPDLPAVDPAKTSNLAAAAATTVAGSASVLAKKEEVKPTQTKVQVEVPPKAAAGAKEAPAVDPFDALASILPSADKIVRPEPVFTGPEVKEHDVISEKGQKCGEREDTLPPGYRLEDMPQPPADYKPPEVPKPLSTNEALDALSAGFTSSSVPAAPKKQEKKDPVEVVCAASAGPANFAPAPVKKSQTPAAASTDKNMQKGSDDFSLEAGLPSAVAPTVAVCKFPPPDKRPKMEKVSGDFSLDSGLDAKANKPKTDTAPMPMDALSALVDTLPADVPKPKLPELRPEDIVSEDKHKKEKGVLVGERDDSIHPDYRFNRGELEKLPAPKPEPTMATGEALDILAGDFVDISVCPAAKPPPPKEDSSNQDFCLKREELQKMPDQKPEKASAAKPADKKVADDFSLEAGLTASTAKRVESCAVPPKAAPTDKNVAEKTASEQPKTDPTAPMPMDALSALVDTLPADVPKPKLPELRPEDIVSEDKHKKEKGVLVGERDDSIHPDYRFNRGELEKLPAPKPEPTMATGEALDILAGDFDISVCPAAKPPPPKEDSSNQDFCLKREELQKMPDQKPEKASAAKPADKKVADDFSLEAGLTASTAKRVESCAVPPKAAPTDKNVAEKTASEQPKTDPTAPMPMDALSALVDTLPADVPKPKLPELRPEDIVSEDKHKKEKGVLVGERDDSIHPDYRFNRGELEKLPAPKPEPTMATGEALDILAGDFDISVCPAAKPPPPKPSADVALAGDFVKPTAAKAVQSAAPIPSGAAPQLLAGADNALDALSDTLKDIQPAPQPAPVPVKDMVKEKKAVEERLIKMGERDDSLPPEYRPTEEDLKKMAEEKAKAAAEPKQKPMDDKTALDLLSDDFTLVPQPTVPVVCHGAETKKMEPPVLDSEPLKPMPKKVLESMADTLLPDDPAFKSKMEKPKKQRAEDPSAADQLPAQPSSDVVATSSKKGGKR